MGYYIQTEGTHNKAAAIARRYNGEVLSRPPISYQAIPEGKAVIAVVDNGPFEAAGFCFNESEFKVFTNPNDRRPVQYVLIDRLAAEVASGFTA
jgi:hypothetical protein